jgi:hypothetical protein
MEYEATAALYAWQRHLAPVMLSISARHLSQWPDAYGSRRPIMRPRWASPGRIDCAFDF